MTPVSDNARISRAPTLNSWSSEPTAGSDAGHMKSLQGGSITSLGSPISPWLGNLSPRPSDPNTVAPTDLENSLLFPGMPSNNDQAMLSGQGFLDVNLNVGFDQHGIPDMLDPNQEPDCISGEMNTLGQRQESSASQASKVTELLAAFDQPGLQDKYPHVTSLAKTIGLLEELLQSKAVPMDEVLRVNKFCMSVLGGIMKRESFKSCKSCRMMIFIAMDLMITLYEDGVSGDRRAADQTLPQKASLQFGSFQLEPEDRLMLRNQIIRNELQRCLQMIQDHSSELRDSSSDGPAPVQEVHQKWLTVLNTRARILSSSLRATDAQS